MLQFLLVYAYLPPFAAATQSLRCVQLLVTLWTVAHRLLSPWDFPSKNTGVGCHLLLQGIFPIQGSNPGLLHWQVDSLSLSHRKVNLADSNSQQYINSKYNVCCGFVIYSFYYVELCSFCSCFLESFYHKWMLNFVKGFLCIY